MNTLGTELKPKGITKAHLIEANIGQDYWAVDFENYSGSEEAGIFCKQYLIKLKTYKPRGVGLLLAGKIGVGKTTLLSIILKYLIRARWSCYMTSLSELVELIKRSWDDNGLVSEIDHYKRVDFLGLDDLGKEHQGPTGFSAVTFDNLLRHRMQHRLPTLFTTNLNRNEIKGRYGESALSLIEGRTKVVAVQGPDYRQEILRRDLN